MIRVLLVDDSGFMRLALRRLVEAEGDIRVVGEAADGHAALRAAEALRPDIVAMDLEMPGMDGLEATARLMAMPDPPAVIMVSKHTAAGSAPALAALDRGAVDCVWKDGSLGGVDFGKIERTLREKIRYWASQRQKPGAAVPAAAQALAVGHCDLVVVGASTGGPDAVAALLDAAGPLPAPVVVAQHMPAELGPDYAEHLGRRLGRPVTLGTARLLCEPGMTIVLPGGTDGHLVRSAGTGFALRLSAGGGVVHPSVDLLLNSAAIVARRAVGVVLTGMGRDGAAGAAMLAGRGMPVLAQSAESCVVAGMPNAVIRAGHASVVGSPLLLGQRLRRLFAEPAELSA
jgi:two-component system chemotaxis response regulator CheB